MRDGVTQFRRKYLRCEVRSADGGGGTDLLRAGECRGGKRGRFIGEIAGTVGEGGNADVAGVDALGLAGALIVDEVEDFIAMDGAAEGAAELVLAEGSAGGREVVAGVEIGVAEEVEGAAVEAVAAGFGDDADLAAAELTDLGVEVAGDDAELGDGVEIGNDGGSGVYVFFGIAAVDGEVVGKFALAVDGDGAGVEGSGGIEDGGSDVLNGGVGDGCAGGDACLQGQEIGEAASVEGNGGHLAAGDDLAELGTRGLDVEGVVCDAHGLVYATNGEGYVEAEGGIGIQNDGFALVAAEAGGLDFELIAADGQDGQSVRAFGVGASLVGDAGGGFADCDGGVGDYVTGGIFYRACDAAADESRDERCGEKEEDG